MASLPSSSAVIESHSDASPIPEDKSTKPAARNTTLFESDQPPNDRSEWVNIEAFLADAAQDLALGQLVHEDNFSLSEAMSALEVLDRKMDSGLNAHLVYTLKESIERGTFIPDFRLSNEELLAVMDRLLALEVLYYLGHSLPQTIFTCYYLHNTSLIRNPFLAAYCKATVKTCAFIRQTILQADIYEEEDFVPPHFGLPLLQDLTEEGLLTLLNECERQLTTTPTVNSSNEGTSAPHTQVPTDSLMREAFLARIRFRRDFYAANLSLSQPNGAGLASAVDTLSAALSHLSAIRQTHRNIVAARGIAEPSTGIFEPMIIRRLQTPFAPRPVPVTLPIDETYAAFEKICSDMLRVCSVGGLTSLLALRDFLHDFSSKQPSIVPRAWLCLLFAGPAEPSPNSANAMPPTTEQGSEDIQLPSIFVPALACCPIASLVRDAIAAFPTPRHFLEHADVPIFLGVAGQAVNQFFRVMCYNRSRQRRKIGFLLVNVCPNLQLDADALDDRIIESQGGLEAFEASMAASIHDTHGMPQPPRFFGLWACDFTQHLMVHWLQLGFELELYSEPDMRWVYWYMDYLLGNTSQNQARAACDNELENARKKWAAVRNKKAGKKPKLPFPDVQPPPASAQMLMLDACRALARGLFRFSVATTFHRGVEIRPTPPFGTDEVRFIHRFAPFYKVAAPAPLYLDYFRRTLESKHIAPKQLYEGAVECFNVTKTLIERVIHLPSLPPYVVVELKALAKVAISNIVQVQLLLRQYGNEPTLPKRPVYDFSVHRAFAVITLK